MTNSTSFTPITVRPEGLEHLAFSLLMPQDWQQLTPSREEVDLEKPTSFVSLFAAMMPYTTVVLAIGARPAFSDGTVEQWANYLAGEHKLTVHKSETLTLRSHPAVRLDCEQETEAGPMRIWGVFVEDGGRLYNLTAMAPKPLFPSVMHLFGQMLMSFEIAETRGPTSRLSHDYEPRPAPIRHPRPEVELPPIELDDPHANANSMEEQDEPPVQAREEPDAHLTAAPAPVQAERPGPPEQAAEPEWWVRARSLEAHDHFEEAEQVICRALNHLGGYSQIAYLYELRMKRKLEAGDRDGAIDAYRRSMSWMRAMAAGATSGGEGTAYSLEADQHEAELRATLGFDPGE